MVDPFTSVSKPHELDTLSAELFCTTTSISSQKIILTQSEKPTVKQELHFTEDVVAEFYI